MTKNKEMWHICFQYKVVAIFWKILKFRYGRLFFIAQRIHFEKTKVTKIVAKKVPFTLALLSIRADLESSLTNNTHLNESSILYFNFINALLTSTEGILLKQ